MVLACHADQALRLLRTRPPTRRAVLGAIRYRSNRAVLHRDRGRCRGAAPCWSSWIYRADGGRDEPAIGVTYWMNRLQNIPDDDPLFVTLNPSDAIPDELIYDRTSFDHPVFDARGDSRRRTRSPRCRARNATWFCGAYLRHGFHEDGIASADAGRPPMRAHGALTAWPEHVPAVTWHGRRGAVRHAFRYSVDYVLIDPEARRGPRLFSRNRMNLASVHDRDHGGAPGKGDGAAWAREALAARGCRTSTAADPAPDPAALSRLRVQSGQLLARPARRRRWWR